MRKTPQKGIIVAVALIISVIVGLWISASPAQLSLPGTEPDAGHALIWPTPNFVSIRLDHPALPRVESVADCVAKFGPNDWRTWRAQYFEKRLTLPDDPYRMEHSSFQGIASRGVITNIWTGYHISMHGIKAESFILNVWPGVGMRSGAVYSAFLHPGETSEIWSSFNSETIMRVHKGSGEFYLADHWIPVIRSDNLFAPANCPVGFRCPKGNKEDMVVVIYEAPPSTSAYERSGILVVDKSEAAKAAGWLKAWKWARPEEFGPLGEPAYPPYKQ